MTARLFNFPVGHRAPQRKLDKPGQVLILPIVRIEHDNSIRAQRRRRRAYLAVKLALDPAALDGAISCLSKRERSELDALLRRERST